MRLAGSVACIEEDRRIRILWGDLREEDHLEDPGVDGREIVKLIFNKWDGGMHWMYLIQYSEMWRALVNATMNFWVP
jgi:hypothetical protein